MFLGGFLERQAVIYFLWLSTIFASVVEDFCFIE